jgi:hypothetical protein
MPAMAIHGTPMWNPGQEKDFNSPERILKILQDGGTKLLSEAVEKEFKFQELKGKTLLSSFAVIAHGIIVNENLCQAHKSLTRAIIGSMLVV